MNQQDNELEKLRNQWQALKLDNERIKETNRALSQSLAAERADSHQHSLALRCRIAGILAIVFLPLLAVSLHVEAELQVPTWICWLYGIIGAIMGVMNLWFSVFIGNSDYLMMPTCEAVLHVQKVLLWQARLRTVGLILAFMVLAPLFAHFATQNNAGLLISTVIGMAVGLVIGLLIYSRNRRLAKKMLSALDCE